MSIAVNVNTYSSPGGGETLGGLAKGLAILECFSVNQQRLTISEASRMTAISPAAARRCLRTLEQLGFVAFDGKYYRLTPRLSRLASAYSDLPLPTIARAHLDAVRDLTGKSASLAVLDGCYSLFIARSETDTIVTAAVKVGSRLPAVLSSTGRALLAGQPDAAIQRHIEAISWTDDAEKREAEKEIYLAVAAVRTEGFAHLVDVHHVVRTFAVPVIDSSGQTQAAMSIVAFANQFSFDDLRETDLPALMEQAQDLGRKL